MSENSVSERLLARKRREAEALKTNLKRRKEAARAAGEKVPDPDKDKADEA